MKEPRDMASQHLRTFERVLVNKELLTSTVSVNTKLLIGTVLVNKLFPKENTLINIILHYVSNLSYPGQKMTPFLTLKILIPHHKDISFDIHSECKYKLI